MKNNDCGLLSRFNRMLWQLLITPAVLLLYRPLNEHIFLPKLGSGAPYIDMDGTIITGYFSANSLSYWTAVLLFLLTAVLSVYNTRTLRGWKRIAVIMLCLLVALFAGALFLNYTLWG